METVTRTSGQKDYRIFVCKDCRGIWLNKGIYQAIKEKRTQQDAEQQEKVQLVGDKKADQKKAYFAPSWWWFYPYIFYPRRYHEYIAPVPPVPVPHSCACVACACVASCACACACAGGGAAGCAPKETMYPQISFR